MSTPSKIEEIGNYTTRNLIDREERTVAELLTRFKNLVTLACSPREKGASMEVAAAQAFQIEVESTALGDGMQVLATEDLHRLIRELKELWLFGPLEGVENVEDEGEIDEDSVRVGELIEKISSKLNPQ